MRLVIHIAPSRHDGKAGRAAISAAVKEAMRGKLLVPRRYNLTFTFHGHWDCANGEPRERDPDSVVTLLFDAIAEHGGLGKRGRGDRWLNRNYRVQTFQFELETVIIDLQ